MVLYNIMRHRLDPTSPVPLYHQLAEAIRYQIATGSLRAGDALPALRQAAEDWGVNLHTVRHAYAALAADGLVQTTAPRGTIVIGTRPVGEARAFAHEMILEARTRFGVSPHELSELVSAAGRESTRAASDTLYVVECSDTQASDLARQIEKRWQVSALPWSLERDGEPPSAPTVATYFHYNDIRRRWPTRFSSVRFASIRPDPQLATRLARAGTIQLIERDADMARNIAADLLTAIGADRFVIETRVLGDPGAALADGTADVILFAPRIWGSLTSTERTDPRAVEIRYIFDDDEISRVAKEMGWEARS